MEIMGVPWASWGGIGVDLRRKGAPTPTPVTNTQT
jgi:hypothetical protein